MSITLDKRNATLNAILSEDLLTAATLVRGSLPHLWSGVKGASSASAGKLYFAVYIVKKLDDTEVQPQALVGVSTRATPSAQLGSGNSWAYCSSGQRWTASKAQSFGVTFSPGDRIGCFLDLDSDVCTLSFSHNGEWLGRAYQLPRSDQLQGGLYPHISFKNLEVEVSFNGFGLAAGSSLPQEASDYMSWTAALEQGIVSAPSTAQLKTQAEIEVLVMVGLPGSGKSTWASRYVANHPEKQYALLSMDNVIKQIKGSSQTPGKQKPLDAKTQQLAEQAYKELLDHIETVPRNYVLDDSNVYEDIRSARISQFRKAGFRTRAAVIVLPDSSLFRRQRKQHQEEGKSVPETTIADMRANFSMPEVGDVFQEVFFVEAKPPEANEIAAAQAEAAKAALPMLKARSAGGRQTRSRSAKTTPKRAPAPAKKPVEEKKADADGVQPLTDKSATGKPSTSAATSAKTHKSSDSAVKADSAVLPVSSSKGEVADSTAQEVKPTVAADMSNTDTPADSHKADTAAADVPVADQQVASATGAGDAPASIAEAHSEEPAAHSEEPATAPGANGESIGKAEQEAAVAETSLADAEADGMEAQEAASPEALKADKDAGATAGAGAREGSKDTTTAVANSQANGVKNEEIGKADEVSKPAEERLVKQVVGDSKQDEEMKPAAIEAVSSPAAPQPQPEAQARPKEEQQQQQVEPMEEDSAQPADQPKPQTKLPEAEEEYKMKIGAAAQPVRQETTQPAKEEDEQQAKAMDVATVNGVSKDKETAAAAAAAANGGGGGGSGSADSRGVKRPAAAAVVRAVKQARTTQAAGRLLGNIRNQGTVKRTVIRGRVGPRPPGMRLPPPMSPDAVPASKAGAAAAAAAKDKAGDAQNTKEGADKQQDQGTSFKDVMQQLLPAEQDPKPTPQQSKSTPQATPKGSPSKQDGKQPQRASSTAKASTPHRQDQVTTGSAGPKSSERDRPGRDRSHSSCRDSARPQPVLRQGGRNLPPPISSRHTQGPAQGPNRHQGRDRPAPRAAALGPRDAGVQKTRRRQPLHERAAPHPGQRPGRDFPNGPHRAVPSWDRNAPPPRQGQGPARLPPPIGRRGPAPERRPAPPARAPRDSFGENHRKPNPRVAPRGPAARGPGPDRAPPRAGFPVGRRAGPPEAGHPGAEPPHTAPRNALIRSRVAPSAARREAYPPPVAQPPHHPHAAPTQRAPRIAPPPRSMGNRPAPSGPRAGARAPSAQPFSPPGPSRLQPQHAQQHPASYRSPIAPVTLPPPRLGPLPGGPVPGLGGEDYTPRGRRDHPGTLADRPRSRSRGPPSAQRGTPYSDRPAPRGRQPAAQQLRSAVHPPEQPAPQQYHPPDLAPGQAHGPPQYEQPLPGYAPEPHAPRRGGPDRAPVHADRYAPSPAARGPPQQWQGKPDHAMAVAPAPDYRGQGPPGRDDYGRQGYAGQPRSDVPDRRTDRRGRGSRERNDMRRPERVNDRLAPPVDTGRYAPQGHMDQEYAPGLAPDSYIPRDPLPPSRSHGYPEDPRGPDPGYMPPQQHAQSAPPRYDSPMPGYAPPLAQEPHQPVYGSGAAPMQGYTSTAPPAERQPYYPQQQQQGPARQVPVQQQPQYADPPKYAREPAYSSAPGGYRPAQGGYMDTPPAQGPRGGYSQNGPVSAPRHRSNEYDPGYSGRDQGYPSQSRPLSNPPISHGGMSHDAHAPRGAPRGAQAWAPSPRETSYGGTPHGSGGLAQSGSRQQGSYSHSPANWSGSSRHAPQDVYNPHQHTGNSQVHGQPGGYRR